MKQNKQEGNMAYYIFYAIGLIILGSALGIIILTEKDKTRNKNYDICIETLLVKNYDINYETDKINSFMEECMSLKD